MVDPKAMTDPVMRSYASVSCILRSRARKLTISLATPARVRIKPDPTEIRKTAATYTSASKYVSVGKAYIKSKGHAGVGKEDK